MDSIRLLSTLFRRRFCDNWLSARTTKKIREIARPITLPRKVRFLRFLKSPNSFLIVVPAVVTVAVLASIDWFNGNTLIALPPDKPMTTIIGLLNSSLSVFVAIFGTVMVASVFIIQSMQQLRPGGEQFSTIFRESYFYPILYFLLATTGAMNFVSFFQATFPPSIVARLVILLGLCNFTVALFSIGLLFRSIYNFVNTDRLIDAYMSELKLLIHKLFGQELYARLSRYIYANTLDRTGLTEHLISSPSPAVPLQFNQNITVTDVNIGLLEKLLRRAEQNPNREPNSENEVFVRLGIGQQIAASNPILYLDPRRGNLLKDIQDVYKYSIEPYKPLPEHIQYLQNLDRLHSQLTRASSENDAVNAELALNAYLSLLEEFMLLSSHYGVRGNSFLFPGSNRYFVGNFGEEWLELDNISRTILEALEIALRNNSKQVIYKYFSFEFNLVRASVENKDPVIFRSFLFSNQIILKNAIKNSDSLEYLNHAILRLTEIINFNLVQRFTQIDDVESLIDLIPFFDLVYTTISRLLQTSILHGQTETLSQIIKHWKNHIYIGAIGRKIYSIQNSLLEQELSHPDSVQTNVSDGSIEQLKHPFLLHQATFIGARAWLLQLYRENRLSKDVFVKQWEIFRQNQNSNNSLIENFEQLLSFIQQEDSLLNWHLLDMEYEAPTEEYRLSVRYMLVFDFFLYLVTTHFSSDNIDQIPGNEFYLYLYDTMSDTVESAKTQSANWASICGLDEERFIERCNQILQLFQHLQKKEKRARQQKVIDSGLSQEKVQAFQNEIWRQWENNNSLHQIVTVTHNDSPSITSTEHRITASNQIILYVKSVFLESSAAYWPTQPPYGDYLINQENNKFYRLLLGANQMASFNSLKEAADYLLEHRKNQGKPTTHLITNKGSFWQLHGDPAFNSTNNQVSPFHLGSYQESLCIALNDSQLTHHYLVACDLERGVQITQFDHDDWFNKELFIEVSSLSVEEARQEIVQNRNFWVSELERRGVSAPTDDEIIFHLRQGIRFQIWTDVEIQVKDIEAFDVAVIATNQN